MSLESLIRTSLILPSSGDYCYYKCTYLFFRFGGGWGQFIVFLGLKDLFHKATYSDRNNEKKVNTEKKKIRLFFIIAL